jgi:hypothetical protein
MSFATDPKGPKADGRGGTVPVPRGGDGYSPAQVAAFKQDRQAARREIAARQRPAAATTKTCECCGQRPVDAEGHDICGRCVERLAVPQETVEDAEDRAWTRRWETAPAGVIGPGADARPRTAAQRASSRPDMVGALARRQAALRRF